MPYTPKTWTTGETITAAELNAIEQAASAAAATADTASSGLSGKVDSSTYTAGLAAKADLASGVVPDAQLPSRLSDASLKAAYAPLSGLGPRARVPRARTPITYVIDLGRSDHGATASTGAAASNLADTADFFRGSQSAQVTTNGTGGTAGIRRQGFTALNLTGMRFEVSVKVSDWTRCKSVSVYLGDSGFANYHVFTVWDSTDKTNSSIKPGGEGEWLTLTFDMSSKTFTQGTPNLAAVQGAQIAFIDDNTGNPFVGHANHLAAYAGSPVFPNGVVSFTFDDSFLTHYTVAQPYLARYGFQGTFYTIMDILGATMSSVPYWMTLTNLKALQDGGHEVAAHAATTAAHNATGGFTSLTDAQLDYELRTIKDFLVRNGFAGADHFATPQGITDQRVNAAIKQYFSSNRNTLRKPYDTLKPGPCNNLHSGDMRTLALNQAEVDNAYTNGSWVNFRFHDLVTTPPTPAGTTLVQNKISDFQAVVDYVATKGIPVRTVGDVLSSVAA